jgi:hypothetical protein
MRHAARIVILGSAAILAGLPLAEAQDRNSPVSPPSAAPGAKTPTQSERDQAAEAPSQSPAVISPPATGDENVIPPPKDGATSRMPIIPPPGTPGGKEDVKPQ